MCRVTFIFKVKILNSVLLCVFENLRQIAWQNCDFSNFHNTREILCQDKPSYVNFIHILTCV